VHSITKPPPPPFRRCAPRPRQPPSGKCHKRRGWRWCFSFWELPSSDRGGGRGVLTLSGLWRSRELC
jgi:hypothetical protein